jgi:hypothetical protein
LEEIVREQAIAGISASGGKATGYLKSISEWEASTGTFGEEKAD